MKMKATFSALLLATASFFAVAAPQASRGPLSKAEVLELVSGRVPSSVIAEVVQRDGISFEPTEQVLNEFRKAGADDVVIRAMRDSWRSETANPLSDEDILLLLAGDVRSQKIADMVRQRGIAFQPTDEYFERLRARGAKDELIDALRAFAAIPFSRDQLLQALASGGDTSQIGKGVREHGIDFEPTEEDFGKLRAAGASESLLQAIREAKRVKPPVNQPPNAPELMPSSQTERNAVRVLRGARVVCPPSVSSIPVFASPNDMNTTLAELRCGDQVSILEKDSGRTGFDRILVAGGTEGFVQDSYLASWITPIPRDVTPPVPTYRPEPPYTPQARHDKIEGTVVLWIVIDSRGNVTDVREVSKPLGNGLDEKAIEAVKTWKFKPATHNGVPVPVRVTVEITFRLFH
jgi:TonB family protein